MNDFDRLNEILKLHESELTNRDVNANKGNYGRLLIMAGSSGMAGAAFLSGLAAFRTGIGMVKYFGCKDNRQIIQTLLPEAMYEEYENHDCLRAGEKQKYGFGSAAADDAAVYAAVYDAAAAAEPDKQMNIHSLIDRDKFIRNIKWASHIIIGPGLSKSAEARELVRLLFEPESADILAAKKLIVIDADALNIISDERIDLRTISEAAAGSDGINAANIANIAITPHVAEMQRLIKSAGEIGSLNIAQKKVLSEFADISAIKKNPESCAKSYSEIFSVNVILKDSETVVAEAASAAGHAACEADGEDINSTDTAACTKRIKAGRILKINAGCAAMAKAGSGDTLCGFIAGTAAVLHNNIADALPTAVYLHGHAGRTASEKFGCHGILARDIAECAGDAVKNMYKTNSGSI